MGEFQGLRGFGGPLGECQMRSYLAGNCHKLHRLSRRLVVGARPGGMIWGPIAHLGTCSQCMCTAPNHRGPAPNHWVVTGEFGDPAARGSL